MMVARRAAGRFLVPFVQQVMLSVVGTLVATLVMTAVEQGSPSVHDKTVARPELTSGGKFAARAAAAQESGDDETVPLPSLPLLPPVRAFASAQASDAPAVGSDAVGDGLADHRPMPDLARPARRAARTDTRRRPIEAARDVTPPRRADYVVAEAATASAPTEAATIQADGAGGLWSSTKLILNRTKSYGNTLIDNLIP